MNGQLDIDGGFAHTPAGNLLTARQQHALETIARMQPITSDELGAYLHSYRRAHGGKGHAADERCEWCSSEGNDVGQALARRGLVNRKPTVGWCLPGWKPEADDLSSQNRDGIPS